MINKEALCEKIAVIYPEIAVCGINIEIAFNKTKKVWIVDLRKDDKHLQNHLEINDAEKYLEGKKCGSLGIQVAQLARIKKL